MRFASAALPLVLVLLGGCTAKPPRFSTIAEEFVFNSLTFTPSAATAVGYHRHAGVPLDELMDDFSPAARERRQNFYARFRAGLARDVVPEKLSPEDRADYELVQQQLSLGLFELTEWKPWEHNPTIFVESIGNALFVPYVQDYAPRNARFYHILKRLERIPSRLEGAKVMLQSAPRIWREVAITENEGNLALLAKLRQERPEEMSKKFDEAATAAKTSLEAFNQFLAKDLEGKDYDWRLGKERYAKLFQLTLGTTQTPDQLLAAATAELQRTREEMARLSGWNGKGDPNPLIRARLDTIAKKHATRESYFADAKRDLAEARAFVKAKNLAPLSEPDNLQLIETPEFQRGIYSVGGFNPAPAMEPQLAAQYWLTPIPANWAAERVESKLREYNFYGLKLLTLHEAMPGHYVQFEAANRIASRGSRLLRSVFGNGAYVEGWSIYATQMMLEEGYLNNDPDLKLTFLKQQLRMIANAILDIGLHSAGMTDEAALRLLRDDCFQENEEATAKLQRAKLSSVQLTTYFAGWRDHVRMREIAKAAKGSAFNLRQYHDAVLAAGGLPTPVVCRLVSGRELTY
jgi:uncharacterized protein (DUF885 family)